MTNNRLLKPKRAAIAGLYFGIPMGLLYIFTSGLLQGLIMGILSGFLFGLIAYLFVNSKSIRKQTAIGEETLLPGEKIVLPIGANLVIKPKEFDLREFAFGDLLAVVGMKNKESLGGRLYLTNYRLIFKSHNFNRLKGMVSIFLPTIQSAKNSSYFIVKKLTLATTNSKVELIIDDVDDIINAILNQKNQFNIASIKELQNMVIQYPEKSSNGLKKWDAINTINNIALLGTGAEQGLQLFTNPVGALGGIFIKELLDKSILDEWQKRFE